MDDKTSGNDYLPLSELFSLAGKGCIVTGGASGIGFAIARRMGEAGAKVFIADANVEKAQQAVAQLSGFGYEAAWTRCDVRDKTEVKEMVRAAASSLGAIDILVNNAGIYPLAPFVEITEDDWDRTLSTNLKGAFLCAQEVSRVMIDQKRKACIVNIGSTDSLHPSFGLAHYDASKGGLLMLTKNMALELAKHGIRVNMIAPGHTTTEGTETWFLAGLSEEERERVIRPMEARVPLRRTAEPDDIARVAIFLASEASSYVTGTLVLVDGGRLLT